MASDAPTSRDEPGGASVTVGDDGLVAVAQDDAAFDSDEPSDVTREDIPEHVVKRLAASQPAESLVSHGEQPATTPEQATVLRMVTGVEAQPVELETIFAETAVANQEVLPSFEPVEEIATPCPAPPSRFKSGGGEQDFDRIRRQITDVQVDIRPTDDVMPEDVSAKEFANQPTIDETLPDHLPPDIFCSHTPWPICYRPLYFEDIPLERYGYNVGYLQTGLSGVKFFGSVALAPYKMTRRPPRSCQCSNGFSRVGDRPLPCYGNRRFQWDAALVEGAAIAAVAFILP